MRLVVPDPVLHEVLHQTLEQDRIPVDRGRIEPMSHVDPGRSGLLCQQTDDMRPDLRKIHLLVLHELVVRPREEQQSLDQTLTAIIGRKQGPGELLGVCRGFRIRERDLEDRPIDRKWCPQLVRGVVDEATLSGEGLVQSLEHVVEGVGKLFELVRRSVKRDAFVQPATRARGNTARGRGDVVDRPKYAAGHQPPEPDSTETDQTDCGAGASQQALQRLVPAVLLGTLNLLLKIRDGRVERLRDVAIGHRGGGSGEGVRELHLLDSDQRSGRA